MKSALVLVASPLHVNLALQLLEAEGIEDFDTVYVSSADSLEDRTYYDRISSSSVASRYFFVRKNSSIIQILSSFWRISRARLRKRYNYAVFGSLTSIPLVKTAFKKAPAFLTFDEGVANLNPRSRLFIESKSWNAKIYHAAFFAPSLPQIKDKIVRHYTIHPELENIVESDRVFALAARGGGSQSLNRELPPKTYFIGTEIDKFFNPNLENLYAVLDEYTLDFYVAHQREIHPLDLGIPLLDKRGLIAEEAIEEDADGAPIHLIGWPSTVLFNMKIAERRTMIFPRNVPSVEPLIDLAEKEGCEVVFV